MIRLRSVAALLIAAVSIARPAQGDEPAPQVGELGAAKSIVFRGNKHFTADEIRLSLESDVDVLQAAHHMAPRAEYLKVLQTRIRDGYRYAGFDDVDVRVRLRGKPSQIEVAIREGTKYQAGEIRIIGAEHLAAEQIARCLTTLRPDDEAVSLNPDDEPTDEPRWVTRGGVPSRSRGAVWTPGKTVPFGDVWIRIAEAVVKREYAEAGRRRPEFQIGYAKHGDVADLEIRVADEGPAATIAKVDVRGNKKNSADDVIRFLNVEVGDVFNRALQTRLERALWRSARFCSYRVEFESTPAKEEADPPGDVASPGAGTLVVTLREFSPAPPLSEPLSPEEIALVKFRDWLRGSEERGDEFAFRMSSKDGLVFDFTYAPGHGFIAELKTPVLKDDKPWSYAAVCTDETLAIYAFHRRESFVYTPTESIWTVENRLTLDESKQTPSRFTMGLGAKTPRRGVPQSKVAIVNYASPAFAAAQAHSKDDEFPTVCRVVDGVLTVDTEVYEIDIDAASGKPLDLRFKTDPEFADEVFCKIQHGAFDARRKELQPQFDACRNRYDAERGWESAIRFLIDDPAWPVMAEVAEMPELNLGVQLVRKALDADLLALIGALHDGLFEENETAFSNFYIPNPDMPRTATFDDPISEWLAVARRGAPVLAGQLFPRNSWAWTLAREYGLASMGRDRYLAAEFARASAAENWGPLAELCAAAVAGSQANASEAAAPALFRGMLKLGDAEALRRDCQALLSPDHELGRFAQNLGTFVRSLDDDESAALTALAESDAPWAAALIASLREGDRPIDAAWTAAIEQAWLNAMPKVIAEGWKNPLK